MDNQALLQTQELSMVKKLFPSGIAVGIWLILHFSYDFLWMIENVSLYQNLAAANWVLLVISVGFSSVVIYPIAYFRGISIRMRILAVYILPLAWCIKEFIRVSATVTNAEALFYVFFTPVQLLILIGQVGLIGFAELFCRVRHKKQDSNKRIFSPAPLLAIATLLVFLYFGLLRGGGYDFHLMVKMVYRSLFL